MTQELLYTSAQQGLKPQSRGFCTVVSSYGMAQNLADRLEALSGYRQVFPPGDPRVALNPVVHSHVSFSVGGKKLHVLSRIAAWGVDYTQRANKLAHHVVLGREELNPAGPAATLAEAGFMQQDWDGQTRILPAGRRPKQIDRPPARCEAWQALTGDAGWAGIMAETACTEARKSAVLLFEPGQELLPLFVEALALLPASLRWTVSFSTYYTKLPPGIECQWRGVLAGSAEAKSAVRAPNTLVVNLTRSLDPAPESPFTAAARRGEMIGRLEVDSSPAAPVLPRLPRAVPPPVPVNASWSNQSEIDAGWARRAVSQIMVGGRAKTRSGTWLVLWVLFAGLLLGTLGGAAAFWLLRQETPKTAVKRKNSPEAQPDSAPAPAALSSEPEKNGSDVIAHSPQSGTDSEGGSSSETKTIENEQPLGHAEQPRAENPAPAAVVQPEANLPAVLLPGINLPPRPATNLAPSDGEPATEIPIPQLKAAPTELQILYSDRLDLDKQQLSVRSDDEQPSAWTVWLGPYGTTPSPTNGSPIAKFVYKNDALFFGWIRHTKSTGAQLRNCLLKLTIPEVATCLIPLRASVECAPIELSKLLSGGTDGRKTVPLSEWLEVDWEPAWPLGKRVTNVTSDLDHGSFVCTPKVPRPGSNIQTILEIRRQSDQPVEKPFVTVEWDSGKFTFTCDRERLSQLHREIRDYKHEIANIDDRVNELTARKATLSPRNQEQTTLDKQIGELEKRKSEQVRKMESGKAEIDVLESVEQGAFRFQISMEIDGRLIEIAHTDPRPAPPPMTQ